MEDDSAVKALQHVGGRLVGGTGVDYRRLAELRGEFELGLEDLPLKVTRCPVAVVVEAGLPDRDRPRMGKELAKDDANAAELDRVLYDLADGLTAVAVAVSPYLPETAPRILEALRQPADLSLERVRPQTAEQASGIEPAPPLFPRVDTPTAAA